MDIARAVSKKGWEIKFLSHRLFPPLCAIPPPPANHAPSRNCQKERSISEKEEGGAEGEEEGGIRRGEGRRRNEER